MSKRNGANIKGKSTLKKKREKENVETAVNAVGKSMVHIPVQLYTWEGIWVYSIQISIGVRYILILYRSMFPIRFNLDRVSVFCFSAC